MFIDTHCHLSHFDFRNDVDRIIKRANQCNVDYMINVATKIEDYQEINKVSKEYDSVFSSVGIHPCYVHQEKDILENDFMNIIQNSPKIVAIGESGLDYHHNLHQKNLQKKFFLMQINVSRKTKLPLIIHSRDADQDMEIILRREILKEKFNFIMHCYSSGIKLALAAIELGGYISFSGIVTFKNAKNIKDIVKIIPKEKILIETDSPYLSPHPYRGKRNEPSFLKKILEEISNILCKDFNDTSSLIKNNTLKIFPKFRDS